MATQEHLKESLEHFKQQKQAKLDELRMIELMIRGLQQQVGEIPEQQSQTDVLAALPSGFALFEAKATQRQDNPAGENYKPRPDEFFSLSIADAAKAYLDKVGHAMAVDDILRVITGGGCRVGGADPKRTLSITLSMAKREFVATGSGNYGLRRFYPNMPKLGRPEGVIVPKKKAKAKPSPKRASKPQPKPKLEKSPEKPDPEELAALVAEVLSDKIPKDVDEVVAAVQKRLHCSVKKIAVYSLLRKKDFEQVGDKYRPRQSEEDPQVVQ
jgi:hypothetical protein